MEQKIITIDVPTTVAVKVPPRRRKNRDLSTLYALVAAASIALNIILAVAR